ncbi:NAD(P)-dependent oxidoreductase [Bordetella genomosp. 8]|nr:NAD(P)-dependent oxidoreductase [Bordetella genomosp. 8]
MSTSTTRTVGIAGLGLMGSASAQRLALAGFELRGYDVDPARCSQFANAGEPGRAAVQSLADLAVQCDVIVLAVFDTEQVEQALFGPTGIVQAAKAAAQSVAQSAARSAAQSAKVAVEAAARAAGRMPAIVCISTCDPDRIAAVAQRCAEQGVPFVESPISGTSATLAKGEAVGLVAGRDQDLELAAPVLDALCARRYAMGAPGNAARAKLAVNLVLGLNRAALAEGLQFAGQLGLDPQEFLSVLTGSAAYSRVMEVKGPAMAQRRFDPPQSRVDQSLKDFRLILEQGRSRAQHLPFAEVYVRMLEDCIAHGEAQFDNAAIIEAIGRSRD